MFIYVCIFSCICIYLVCICMYLYINMCRMICTKSRTRHAETIYKIPYIYNLHQRIQMWLKNRNVKLLSSTIYVTS